MKKRNPTKANIIRARNAILPYLSTNNMKSFSRAVSANAMTTSALPIIEQRKREVANYIIKLRQTFLDWKDALRTARARHAMTREREFVIKDVVREMFPHPFDVSRPYMHKFAAAILYVAIHASTNNELEDVLRKGRLYNMNIRMDHFCAILELPMVIQPPTRRAPSSGKIRVGMDDATSEIPLDMFKEIVIHVSTLIKQGRHKYVLSQFKESIFDPLMDDIKRLERFDMEFHDATLRDIELTERVPDARHVTSLLWHEIWHHEYTVMSLYKIN